MNPQLKEWIGEFGRHYTDRNPASLEELEKLYKDSYGITRSHLNSIFLNGIKRSARILEIGCNVGVQLLCLQKMGFSNLYGIEPQGYAIRASKERLNGINVINGNVFDIPFKDCYFDIVFTSGVLIHIAPRNIKKAFQEIYRCSGKYIWGFEYYAAAHQEIIYRGAKKLLWKANFPKLYVDAFPDLNIVKIEFIKYLKNDNIDVMFLLKRMR